MISERGINVNQVKIKALLKSHTPTLVKDVQSLLSKITALSRFISQYGDKCRTMFKLLMKQETEPGRARVRPEAKRRQETKKPPSKLHSHGLPNIRRLSKKLRNTSPGCRRSGSQLRTNPSSCIWQLERRP